MEFLDLVKNDLFVNILDLYFLITICLGMVLMFLFLIFSEKDVSAIIYLGSFTIIHVYGLVFRQLLLG